MKETEEVMILTMLEDAMLYGVIEASCEMCKTNIRCEPDAIDAYCDVCEGVRKVNGLAALGMI